jgi:hypothetical protein
MPIQDPNEEYVLSILIEILESGDTDFLNIPGIVDVLKVHYKDKILKRWKDDNRVSLCYCADCGAIQFIKIEIEAINCKYCGSTDTDFVSRLIEDEEESIPDDFEEEFNLKKWDKEHKTFMKKNKLKVV